MVANPPLDLTLSPVGAQARSLQEWLTTFHLVTVVLDPFTNESAWLLPTASRILTNYEQSDCRVSWVVTGTEEECRLFLGPWAREILTFADPDRSVVKALGLERLPAIVHLATDGTVVSAAEGWDPDGWKAVTDTLSQLMSWNRPLIPAPGDPGPYEGTPAAG